MRRDTNDLKWLLAYELKQAVRYRRYVSLVMLSAKARMNKLHKLLKGNLRASDAVFLFSNAIGILMGETDCPGALKAVERYKKAFKGTVDVGYSVTCFPDDGKATDELVQTGQRRLKSAMALGYGSVVAEGQAKEKHVSPTIGIGNSLYIKYDKANFRLTGGRKATGLAI